MLSSSSFKFGLGSTGGRGLRVAAHFRGPGILGTFDPHGGARWVGPPRISSPRVPSSILRSKKNILQARRRAGNSAACPRLGDQPRRADLMGPVAALVCSTGLEVGAGALPARRGLERAAGAGLCCVLYESGAASEPGTVPVPALATRTLEGTSATGRRRLGLACTGSSSHLNGPRWQAPRYLPSPTRTHPGRPRTPARA